MSVSLKMFKTFKNQRLIANNVIKPSPKFKIIN